MRHVLLVGNPNCGKSTLFNALTGGSERIGNWPGVTVEKKTSTCTIQNDRVQITDLPGVYSLVLPAEGASQDVQITTNVVMSSDADLIINVVDACHLERHLYLTSQLLELGKPLIVVLNMMDIASQRGITIDSNALADQLQCLVVPLQAHRQIGLVDLKKSLVTANLTTPFFQLTLPPSLQIIEETLKQHALSNHHSPRKAAFMTRRILEGEPLLVTDPSIVSLEQLHALESDVLMADARYHAIHKIVQVVQKKSSDASEYFTAKLDKIVLHRFLALPIFFAVMYLMFLLAINVGGAFQDFFDMTSDAIFVQGSRNLLQMVHAPQWLIALCANGVGKGINTTVTFIPVLSALFFLLSILEISGYMARAAFVVDKVMRTLGLPGKSFVPMIVGFGCNVPAIMAARTLDSERDRMLTVLMSPFMSCSARLAIYAVFVAAFFPTSGQNIVFSLYFIGILMAVLTGFMLRKTVLRGQTAPFILELPAYHRPALRRLLRETFLRLRYFLVRAGRLIIPVCVILGGLNAWMVETTTLVSSAEPVSVLALIGQWITPLFSPMGIHQDNWPAVVGLLTGTLAKEVVVGSLNSLYSQMGHFAEISTGSFDFLSALQAACWSIPHNLAQLGNALVNPIVPSASIDSVSNSVYGIMYQQFHGRAGAYAYLLFILLYIPCVSTMAAIRQETNSRLMWFSILWSLLIAYTAAVLFYQLATFTAHPLQTVFWFISLVLLVITVVAAIRFKTRISGGRYAVATP